MNIVEVNVLIELLLFEVNLLLLKQVELFLFEIMNFFKLHFENLWSVDEWYVDYLLFLNYRYDLFVSYRTSVLSVFNKFKIDFNPLPVSAVRVSLRVPLVHHVQWVIKFWVMSW